MPEERTARYVGASAGVVLMITTGLNLRDASGWMGAVIAARHSWMCAV
jgi:hypothetical protein